MFNFVRSLFAAQYAFRVSLNLGSTIELTDASLFPNFAPLVRKARVNGLKAKECAKMLQLIVKGVDSSASLDAVSRAMAIDATLLRMEKNADLWEMRL